MPFSQIRENFPRLFHPASFPPNVYAGFLKSVSLISPFFHFSTPIFPNNHGPPTRVRCERVLFFPEPCHTLLKTYEPNPTNATLRSAPVLGRSNVQAHQQLHHAQNLRQPTRDFGLRWQAQRDTAFASPSNPYLGCWAFDVGCWMFRQSRLNQGKSRHPMKMVVNHQSVWNRKNAGTVSPSPRQTGEGRGEGR